jgi:hypothetical protein
MIQPILKLGAPATAGSRTCTTALSLILIWQAGGIQSAFAFSCRGTENEYRYPIPCQRLITVWLRMSACLQSAWFWPSQLLTARRCSS